jgi:hypothetical protein
MSVVHLADPTGNGGEWCWRFRFHCASN